MTYTATLSSGRKLTPLEKVHFHLKKNILFLAKGPWCQFSAGVLGRYHNGGSRDLVHIPRTGPVTHLVHKLFHSGLQAPHLELDGHQLVGAHDGLMVISPAFSKLPPACLLRPEVFRILEKAHQENRHVKTLEPRHSTGL